MSPVRPTAGISSARDGHGQKERYPVCTSSTPGSAVRSRQYNLIAIIERNALDGMGGSRYMYYQQPLGASHFDADIEVEQDAGGGQQSTPGVFIAGRQASNAPDPNGERTHSCCFRSIPRARHRAR